MRVLFLPKLVRNDDVVEEVQSILPSVASIPVS